MAFKASVVSVGSSATSIVGAGSPAEEAGAGSGGGRMQVTLRVPVGGQTVYVGGDNTVSTGTGFPVNGGEVLTVDHFGTTDALFGIVASGTQNVNLATAD